jgi:DNA-binding NtrC family response regulator
MRKGWRLMADKDRSLLEGKKILIVDDERDVLATLTELLPMCRTTTASSFEGARELLEEKSFDIAILDIMGVDGYKLLDIAKKKGIIPVMLTAHALSVEDTVRSFKKGAAFYLPKDAMPDIATFLEDILEAKQKGRNFWWRWLERFEDYYDRKFGPGWKNKDKEFWDKFNFPT